MAGTRVIVEKTCVIIGYVVVDDIWGLNEAIDIVDEKIDSENLQHNSLEIEWDDEYNYIPDSFRVTGEAG